MKNANVVVEKKGAMTGHRSNQANEGYTHPTGADTSEVSRELSELGSDIF